MKQLSIVLLLTLILVSCGTDSQHFKIDGRFLHLNQGEFYVYSPDGGIDGLDTIKVQAGRFVYETPCTRPCILMMVFPNFSEQPIFAEPGKTVSVQGDASHLKEMETTGTKSNELMTKFRKEVANSSPPETKKQVEQFIKDHPDSPVGVYLVSKYFMQVEPNYKKANELIETMLKKQERYGYLIRLHQLSQSLANSTPNGKLPAFKATDIEGNAVSSSTLTNAKVAVITLWSSWNYDSMSMQRELKSLKRKAGGQLQLLSINIDAGTYECKSIIKRDSISWPNICDGEMMEGSLVRKIGFASIPDNIILHQGKIVGHSMNIQQLREKVEELLHI